MNDIQKARDVLAKWREGADASQAWVYEESSRKGYYGAFAYSNNEAEYTVTSDATDGNARLIVGTAGNPAMWDAIDGLLATGQYLKLQSFTFGDLVDCAERVAAAIMAADERMSA